MPMVPAASEREKSFPGTAMRLTSRATGVPMTKRSWISGTVEGTMVCTVTIHKRAVTSH